MSHHDAHPTCPGPYRILFSKTQAVSTSHFCHHAKRQFCISKAILNFHTSFWHGRRQFSTYFIIFKFSASAMETLVPLKLFAQPMARAEVLHALSYNIELSWKNIPENFNLVKLILKNNFPAEKIHICPTMTPTQHARGRIQYCPPRSKPSLRITYFWCNTAHGANTMTLRSTFSTRQICVYEKWGLTPDLGSGPTPRKQIVWNLAWFQAGPHQKLCKAGASKAKSIREHPNYNRF